MVRVPKTYESRLEELKKEVKRELRPVAQPVRRAVALVQRPSLPLAIVLGLGKFALILALPFLVYVRSAVGLYSQGGLSPVLSVIGAGMITAALLAIYAAWLSRRFKGRKRAESIMRWVGIPTLVAWAMYSLFYLASSNAKSAEVRDEYRSLHPVLRVAVATAIMGDGDLVLTDSRRVASDYGRMGLPVNQRTKHYEQKNGWVHAVDLRTNGRSEIRNWFLQAYFKLMGFQTLRHVGTADHLHIQLAVRP
jgi:hypothetical protein